VSAFLDKVILKQEAKKNNIYKENRSRKARFTQRKQKQKQRVAALISVGVAG
jgi:hypothetical protein